jgi:hypothetical protein
MTDRQGRYRIIETPCFPNSWKISPVNGRDSNATCYYHPTKEDAETVVEKTFNGIVIETIYLEN